MFIKHKGTSAINTSFVQTIQRDILKPQPLNGKEGKIKGVIEISPESMATRYIIVFFYTVNGNTIWIFDNENERDSVYEKIVKLVGTKEL